MEAQIYEYPEVVEAIASRRDDIIDAGIQSEIALLGARIQANRRSDPTQSKGMRLADDPYLRRVSENMKAVESVLARLTPEGRNLVRLYYWERNLTAYGVAKELHMSVPSFYRYRRYIVWAVAHELGMVPQERNTAAIG